MNGCAVVYMPGLTGSSSGSVTDGSATSVAKRDRSGDHTGSPTESVEARRATASPRRCRRPAAPSGGRPRTNIRLLAVGVHENRPRSVSLRAAAGAAPAASTGSTNVSFCSLPMTPSVSGAGAT